MGKLLQSRLLSELCPGGAGRPIELGIFIPHPLPPRSPEGSTLSEHFICTEVYGGTVVRRQYGGVLVREKYCSHKAP